ncbi:MAG: SGNH/GDSL hydrolase family protein [Planctomycetes bacterium]|nr:SGNH/GDSL hydrolase family protein [Planctomycetota bacterium]
MRPRARRLVARAARLGLGLVLAVLLAEGALRFVLFSDQARAWSVGWSLRHEGLYTAHASGREFWQLRARLASEPPSAAARLSDERVGWLGERFDRDLVHVDEPGLGARTPVLLFGDSYAHCVEPAGPCWQGLLERSELAPRFALLNYGVGGYGLDQTYLLMRLVLPRFQARAPVVVIGILVDDDLDRCYLALRDAPKPYFTLQGGDLMLHPPEARDTPSFLRAHPLEIHSYLWRLFTFKRGWWRPRRPSPGPARATTWPSSRRSARASCSRCGASSIAAACRPSWSCSTRAAR